MTPSRFILEEGIASGGAEAFAAMLILYGMSYAAEQMFLEPDPAPNVTGAILQVRIAGRLHEMVPCPHELLVPVVACFRRRTGFLESTEGLSMGRIPVSIAGVHHDIGVAIIDERSVSLFFPRVPVNREAAHDLLMSVATGDGLIEFHDDMEKPSLHLSPLH